METTDCQLPSNVPITSSLANCIVPISPTSPPCEQCFTFVCYLDIDDVDDLHHFHRLVPTVKPAAKPTVEATVIPVYVDRIISQDASGELISEPTSSSLSNEISNMSSSCYQQAHYQMWNKVILNTYNPGGVSEDECSVSNIKQSKSTPSPTYSIAPSSAVATSRIKYLFDESGSVGACVNTISCIRSLSHIFT